MDGFASLTHERLIESNKLLNHYDCLAEYGKIAG